MLFKISKVKNTILLVGAVGLFFVCYLLLKLLIPNESLDYLALLIVGICCLLVVIRVIYDYKTWISIEEYGFSMYRRGRKYSLRWNEIKRIEYSGVRWCKAFDTLLIYTGNETLYVEYTFNDYETIWALLRDRYSQAVPTAIIDTNIPMRK